MNPKLLSYHHMGIPTSRHHQDEEYLPTYRLAAWGFEESPYGVEWMRFDEDCPLPELVKTVPHVAFVVEDLEKALEGKNVIIKPNRPSEGVTVAFIEDHGAPIELIQYDDPANPPW